MGKKDKGKRPIQVACEVEDIGDDDGDASGDEEDEDLTMMDDDTQIDDIGIERDEIEDL